MDGRTILDETLMTSMMIPSIRSQNYGLGIHIHYQKSYALGHIGGGLGFSSSMFWFPEYEFGYVFLGNAVYSNTVGEPLTNDLFNENLIQKNESVDIPSVEHQAYQPLDPNTFTPFKPAWKKYIGTYEFVTSGWELGILMRIALGLGLTSNVTHLKVFEKDGFLYVDSKVFYDDDGGRLDEHLPGLFFTPSGKCLDLRGPAFTWLNHRMKKVDNNTDRSFDINMNL